MSWPNDRSAAAVANASAQVAVRARNAEDVATGGRVGIGVTGRAVGNVAPARRVPNAGPVPASNRVRVARPRPRSPGVCRLPWPRRAETRVQRKGRGDAGDAAVVTEKSARGKPLLARMGRSAANVRNARIDRIVRNARIVQNVRIVQNARIVQSARIVQNARIARIVRNVRMCTRREPHHGRGLGTSKYRATAP